ncbi:MAG: zinc ABC transporter substrate-binding protein [Neomegalonema sp.]|nr:zinc ABC transporter substrate-binding protein [Neomegalonema sp.]
MRKTSPRPLMEGRQLKRRALLRGGAALFALGGPLSGCMQTAPKRGAKLIAATTGMVADAVRVALGRDAAEAEAEGKAFELSALMGAGVDPHSYRETRADVATLLKADAVFWNGLFLEAQLEPLLLKLAKDKTVVALGEATPTAKRRAHDDYAGRYDPHVWMDPSLWRYAVRAAADAITKLAPERASRVKANTAAYLDELSALDAYAKRVLASVSSTRRVLITAHDAFGYFGAAYGYEVVGIQGVSTESEAGLARIRSLVDLIVSRGVGAVFVESSVSRRNVDALLEGARARGAKVAVGAELFSDAMGAPGTYEGTYLGMIDHNVTSITRALGGEAPARGRLGKLGEKS